MSYYSILKFNNILFRSKISIRHITISNFIFFSHIIFSLKTATEVTAFCIEFLQELYKYLCYYQSSSPSPLASPCTPRLVIVLGVPCEGKEEYYDWDVHHNFLERGSYRLPFIYSINNLSIPTRSPTISSKCHIHRPPFFGNLCSVPFLSIVCNLCSSKLYFHRTTCLSIII